MVWKRVWKIIYLVWNTGKVLRTVRHTPTQNFGEGKFAVHQQAVRMDNVGQSSDEWPWRKKSVTTSRWELSDSSTKMTDSVYSDISTDGTATNTSRVVNEPITSIPKNNRLLSKYISNNLVWNWPVCGNAFSYLILSWQWLRVKYFGGPLDV